MKSKKTQGSTILIILKLPQIRKRGIAILEIHVLVSFLKGAQ